jgi:hypothetical protein
MPELMVGLGCLSFLFSGLSENSAAIQGVVDNFSDSGSVRVYVHSITGPQVAQNALCGNLESHANQFRIASSLNVVNPKNSLVKW